MPRSRSLLLRRFPSYRSWSTDNYRASHEQCGEAKQSIHIEMRSQRLANARDQMVQEWRCINNRAGSSDGFTFGWSLLLISTASKSTWYRLRRVLLRSEERARSCEKSECDATRRHHTKRISPWSWRCADCCSESWIDFKCDLVNLIKLFSFKKRVRPQFWNVEPQRVIQNQLSRGERTAKWWT